MKAFTDIAQSKKLAEILPIDSADMRYTPDLAYPWVWDGYLLEDGAIPCWSLAALLNLFWSLAEMLNILSKRIHSIDEDATVILSSRKNIEWNLSISNSGLEAVTKSDPIDACVEMIIKLNEQKLL